MRQVPTLLVALLKAINKGARGFKQEEKDYTVYTSTLILALASINARDLV
jgi:hypothetical protein